LTNYRVAFMEGDGVGPEVARASRAALEALEAEFDLRFDIAPARAGDACLRETGAALPEESVEVIRRSDACLKGPVGETAADVIVRLRRDLDLFANVRPVKGIPGLKCLAPWTDLVIVRENTEDLYAGLEFDVKGGAIALRVITKKASKRIAEYAFGLAESRKGKSVVAVHKSNVLRKSDGLFAKACRSVWKRHPRVSFSEMYVDAAAMNLIRSPERFDVVLTTNLYGDILSDEASQLVGGLGLTPGANIGDRFALFEPVHGSAPDIAKRGVANPTAMLLATAMMLEWLDFRHEDRECGRAAARLRSAVETALRKGMRTPDLGGNRRTAEVSDFVVRQIRRPPTR